MLYNKYAYYERSSTSPPPFRGFSLAKAEHACYGPLLLNCWSYREVYHLWIERGIIYLEKRTLVCDLVLWECETSNSLCCDYIVDSYANAVSERVRWNIERMRMYWTERLSIYLRACWCFACNLIVNYPIEAIKWLIVSLLRLREIVRG